MAIILVVIGGYSINGYEWLLMAIILVVIGGYSINGYWWLFY
jgi:ribose/xylose/arabinose/galactoside ABC-type transport system permease subunit